MTNINTVYSMLLYLGPDYYTGCTQLEQTLILVLNSIQYTCTDFYSIDDSKDLYLRCYVHNGCLIPSYAIQKQAYQERNKVQ